MKNVEKIKQGDLYSLLAACTNEELEPLVKIITEASTNHLDIDPLYKEHSPNHIKYYKKIADEIRLFGSDSFASLFRGGEGVDYKEVVRDVCKRLNIPYEENNLPANERNLISIYELEKENFASSDITKALTFVAYTLITKIHPVGAFASTVKLSSPAFRVTVPCVLHIAILRRKKLKEYEYLLKKQEDIRRKNNKIKELLIVNSKNEKVLCFSEMLEFNEINSISVSKSEIGHLNSLIQSIPSFIAMHEVKNKKYMEVVINGNLIKAADGNGYRALSKAGDGKFAEHARLFDANKLSKLVNFSALYSITSTVVAQKHLADINSKLDNINNLLKQIENFQNNERESKIKGTIQYFEQVVGYVVGGGTVDSIRNQIESKECELLEIQTHLLKDIHNLNLEKNLKGNDTFGTKDMENVIENHMNDVYTLHSQLLLCVRARACGWQLLTFYPETDGLLDIRFNNIKKFIELFGENFLNKTDECIKYNIKGLAAIFNKEYTQNARKLSLLNKNEVNMKNIKTNIQNIEEELKSANHLYQSKKFNSVNLLLKIEDGKITDVG